MTTRSLLYVAVIAAAPALASALPHCAVAQSNPVISNLVPASETVSLQAKITAIDPAKRWVTLANASGQQVTVEAGPAVRLDLLKVGDRVNAVYRRSVAFAVSAPEAGMGTPMSDDQIKALLAQPAQAPGGIGVALMKVQGTVVGIDLASHSIDIVNPSGGGIYTVEVTDPSRIAALSKLRVGDTITAVITEALAVSIEPARTSWF